ncbi:protein IWS1 A isoform X1 [Tripterygium wilfordii]|uniref:Protein IWS1 A isoform X1 n=1 Tax=Tripterygium wilfordii TaxID=458696 RepID=A0A7J7CE47_TRIWF|nr:uncharacterized protein LOC119984605 [Tripterygium wilfordii]KAF5732409.1 protein IWS1 A isoform X1 [Tripterygium wilfordii]
MEVKLEEVEDWVSNGALGKKEVVGCRCSELEEKSKRAEARCTELESKLLVRKREYEDLEAKFKALEAENVRLEGELKGFKCHDKNRVECGREREVEGLGDLTGGEEDRVVQLMIENNVLGVEKKRAQSEAEIWMQKHRELELRISQLTDGMKLSEAGAHVGSSLGHFRPGEEVMDSLVNGIGDQILAGTPYMDISHKRPASVNEGEKCVRLENEVNHRRRVRRNLSFEEEKSPIKKIAPLTPGGDQPASLGIIDISDSDEEPDNTLHIETHACENQGNEKVHTSSQLLGGTNGITKEINLEDDIDVCKNTTPSISTPKRKRAANIITSDSESSDDNVPICQLKRMHIREKIPDQATSQSKGCSVSPKPSRDDNLTGIQTRSRRRLVTLGKRDGKGGAERKYSNKTSEANYHRGIPTTDNVEDDESEEFESESGSDSMKDFIDDGSGVSDADDASSKPHEESDGNMEFGEIISGLNRSKYHKKLNWEFEADMLADFGKDPEMCMKAVCVLYRQQTNDEKVSKEALHSNGRGFSKFDAPRGCTLAEFLTNGDPHSDPKKSVEELHEYDPMGVEICRNLADRYSKQLFEIYKNGEDPLFLPS